ncbi:MAG: hypothetical protein JSV20_01755 [Candidatus Bathyarchaeota archaeon]|nr:MAG: hypothetical protein JSV20_01755 [Candidatus Bathyarchaeota archaeon]
MARINEEERWKYEIYKELENLISKMNYDVDAAIVEGPHDKKTLKLLGYTKPILICSKRSHNELVDLIAKRYPRIVVLTDFDEQGVILNKKLSDLFEKRGVKVDRFYRTKFLKLLKAVRISTIEGIYSIKHALF